MIAQNQVTGLEKSRYAFWGSLVAQKVKSLPGNAGDLHSILGQEAP